MHTDQPGLAVCAASVVRAPHLGVRDEQGAVVVEFCHDFAPEVGVEPDHRRGVAEADPSEALRSEHHSVVGAANRREDVLAVEGHDARNVATQIDLLDTPAADPPDRASNVEAHVDLGGVERRILFRARPDHRMVRNGVR